MAESFSKITDSRKLFKKTHGDGEDPIIIAQRFLNIFRQLHIFNNERKDAFNKMILEQPPEIRGMFGTLPGGSLLQEYVDELDQTSEITPEQTTPDILSSELSDEISKAKILATALAEAQLQASARFQQNAPQMQAPFQNAPISSGPIKVIADASFAKEIAAAFTHALKYSEEGRKSETREIAAAIILSQEKMAQVIAQSVSAFQNTAPVILENHDSRPIPSSTDNKDVLEAIMESQNKMAQMFMQHNNVSASSSSNNNANNIQINTAPMPPIDDMVRSMIKAQSELFREMSEAQTKELSTVISIALKESQKLSSQTVVETLAGMQKETQRFWEMYAKNAPQQAVQSVLYQTEEMQQKQTIRPSYSEESFDTHSKPLTENTFSEKTVLAKSVSFLEDEENDNDEIDNLLASDYSEALDDNIENGETLPKKKKKKKKKKNKNRDNMEILSEDDAEYSINDSSGLDVSLFDDVTSTPPAPKINIKSGLNNLAASIFGKSTNEDIAADLPIDLGMSLSEEDGDLTWRELPEVEIVAESNSETSSEDDDDDEWVWEEVPTEPEKSVEAPVLSTDVELSEEDDDEWVWEEVPAEPEKSVEAPVLSTDVEPSEEEDDEDGEWVWEETFEEPEIAPENNITNIQVTLSEDSKIASFETINEPEENLISLGEQNFSDFNFEKINLDDTSEVPVSNNFGLSEQEPAKETESDLITPEKLVEEDWEWEYEENPESELPVNNPIDKIEVVTEETSEEDGDWEWEYEENPENELPVNNPADKIEVVTVVTEETSEEDGDWEWEYEENPGNELPVNTSDSHETPVISAENSPLFMEKAETSKPQENINQISISKDPYSILENLENNEDDTILNPLFSNDFVFEDNLYQNNLTKESKPVIHMEGLDLGIAEIGNESDKKEPYIPKDDIIG